MSAAALLSETLPAARSADWARPMVERQLQVLGRLADAGMELVEALVAQAKGGEAVVEGDVAMAFNRVARAVRQTSMLQSKLIEALQDYETGRATRLKAMATSPCTTAAPPLACVTRASTSSIPASARRPSTWSCRSTIGRAQSAGPAAGSASGRRAAADISERIVNTNESIVKVGGAPRTVA